MEINMNSNPLFEAIYRLNVNERLWEDLCYDAFLHILNNEHIKARDTQLWILLNWLMAMWPSAEEVTWLIKAAFKIDSFDIDNKIEIELPLGKKLAWIVGSWKKWHKTVNVSTAACIIASAAWVFIAKPWSSSTSSVSGSADILRHIWANIDIWKDRMIEIIKKIWFWFFPIENMIPNFDKLYWWKFFAPHALSLALPALLCPIKLDRIIYWLAHPNIELSAEIFYRLWIKNIFVVSTTDDGIHYLDEIWVYGNTKIIWIKDWIMWEISSFEPYEIFQKKYSYQDIRQWHDIEENLMHFIEILSWKWDEAKEDIACINAWSLIYISWESRSIEEWYHIAKDTVKSGKALMKIKEFILYTGWNLEKFDK